MRSDLDAFRPLLARYLDVQKRRDIAVMDEREIRGRWKSFVGKWNRGDLAEGWYDPEMFAEAKKTGAGAHTRYGHEGEGTGPRTPPPPRSRGDDDSARSEEEEDEKDEDEDDEYGPTLPPGSTTPRASARRGPGIPTLQDLSSRREDAEEARAQNIEDLRLARKADRAEQRARLDDLAPKADAGTRERRLEKRRETNDKMRGFRERSPGAAEVGETELMGGGDGVAEYKRAKAVAERRRTEREVRREEEARAKAAEREERVREYRRKEEGTMEVLRRIARERFG